MRLSACVFAALAGVLGAAPARATVTALLDVDRDGAVDTLQLDRGRLAVLGKPALGEVRLPAGKGAERVVTNPRQPGLVVVESGGELALIGARGRFEILWQGPAAAGDGDFPQALELSDEGALRYVVAPFARCDGTPARWLLHGWDGASRKFRPAAVSRGAGGLQTARPVASPPASIGWTWAGASSRQGATTPEAISAPSELADGKPETAWRPAGDGRGASVIARGLRVGVTAVELVAAPGTRLPRVVNVVLSPTSRVSFVRAEDARAVRLALPAPVETDCVEVEVVEPTGPVALAEVRIGSILDGPDGLARLVAEAADPEAGPRGDRAAEVAVQAGAGTQLGQALGRATDRRVRRRLVTALVARMTDDTRPAVTAALATGAPEVADALRAAAAVPAMREGVGAVARAVVENRAASREARGLAAGLCGQARTPACRAALLGALGAGERPLRTAVVHALLGEVGLRVELPALVKDASGARLADLARLATHAPATPTLDAALADALGRAAAFEARARLVQALAAHGSLSALEPLLRKDPDDVVRSLVIEGVGPAPGADPLLRAALADPAPRVRLAAIKALSGRRDLATAAAFVDLLAKDRWIKLRAAAARALGTGCADLARAPLREAARREEDDDVREAALAALGACRDRQLPALLEDILAADGEDVRLRARAVTLLAQQGSAEHRQTLAKLARDPGADALLRVAVVEGWPCAEKDLFAELAKDPDPGVARAAAAQRARCRQGP